MSVIKVTAHNRCESTERFVYSHDYDQQVPKWHKVQACAVGDRRVITCARCNRPAMVVDAHWPWMIDGCRCIDHQDFKKFPLDG